MPPGGKRSSKAAPRHRRGQVGPRGLTQGQARLVAQRPVHGALVQLVGLTRHALGMRGQPVEVDGPDRLDERAVALGPERPGRRVPARPGLVAERRQTVVGGPDGGRLETRPPVRVGLVGERAGHRAQGEPRVARHHPGRGLLGGGALVGLPRGGVQVALGGEARERRRPPGEQRAHGAGPEEILVALVDPGQRQFRRQPRVVAPLGVLERGEEGVGLAAVVVEVESHPPGA
jgi:hypothetical protein